MPRVRSGRVAVYMGLIWIVFPLSIATLSARALAESPAQPPQVYPTADPEYLLRQSLQRCDVLDSYEMTFTVRERRGALHSLNDWERIKVDYRRNPKTVKMIWLNTDSQYVQAVYIQGSNHDKVQVLPRRGLLGLAPRPFSADLDAAVAYGKSLRPITDIGLAELIRLTFREMEQASHMGAVHIDYAGQSYPPDESELADHIIIDYPTGYADANREDIYISTRTGYPIAAYLWQPNGELLATYLYGPPDPPGPPIGQSPPVRSPDNG